MGLQDVVEETVGEVMAKCDALKRENEELRYSNANLVEARNCYLSDAKEAEAEVEDLKRENEKLRTESGFLEAGARKLEARIAALEKENEELRGRVARMNVAHRDAMDRAVDGMAVQRDRILELEAALERLEREYYATAKAKFEARIAQLEVVYVEAAKIVQLEHDALIEALRAVDAKE